MTPIFQKVTGLNSPPAQVGELFVKELEGLPLCRPHIGPADGDFKERAPADVAEIEGQGLQVKKGANQSNPIHRVFEATSFLGGTGGWWSG